jgi:hypothetical protein
MRALVGEFGQAVLAAQYGYRGQQCAQTGDELQQ